MFTPSFVWSAIADQRSLALGLGGGSDAISAFAIAHVLGAGVAYGNTKHALDDDLVRISPHVGRVPTGAAIRGTTKIERRLPAGPHDSPLVVAYARDEPPDALVDELGALAFDRVIGVDTGGDALDATRHNNRGRDRRMVEVLRGLGVPVLLAILAPGADGQQSHEALAAALAAEHAAGRFRGAFSLQPYLPILREHGRELGANRTPNIICRAFDETTDPVEIPRARRPAIPRAWLMSGLVFEIAA